MARNTTRNNRSDLINSICSLNLGPNPNKYFNLGERQDLAYLEGHHQIYRRLHVLSCSPRERHPVIFLHPHPCPGLWPISL
jgi:hypothetical protein